jgi:hypothetical protein
LATDWGPDGRASAREPAAATRGHRLVDGCQIDRAPEHQRIWVWTWNNLYEFEVVDGPRLKVLIRGGKHCEAVRAARLAGARPSRTEIRLGGIYLGLPLEIHFDDRVILTSPVRKIELTLANFAG